MEERRKRTEITCHISQDDLQKAVDTLNRFTAYEEGRLTLTKEEMERYNQYQEHMRPIYKEMGRLIDEVRRSQILTREDYSIVINARG